MLMSIVFRAKDRHTKHKMYPANIAAVGNRTVNPFDSFIMDVPKISNIIANIR